MMAKTPLSSRYTLYVISTTLAHYHSCANKSQSNSKSNSRNNNNNNLNNNYLKISTGFNVDEDDGTNSARSGAISRKFDETWVVAEKHSTPSKESISYISRKNPSCSVQSYSYSSLSSSSSCGERSRPSDIKRSDSFLKRFRENWPGCEKFIKNIPSYGKKPGLFIKSKDTDHPVPPVRRKRHKTERGICNTDNNLIIPQNLLLPNEQKDNLVTVSSKKKDTIANYNTDNRLLLINASYSSHKGGSSSQEREHRQEFSPGLQGYSTSQLQSSQCIKLIPDRSKLLEQDYERRVSRSRSISTDDVDNLINSNDNFSTSNDNNNYCYYSSSSPSNLKLLKNNRKVKSDLDLSYRQSHLNSNLCLKLKRSPSPENNALYSGSGSAKYSDIILRSSDNSVNELRCLNWSNSTTLHSSVSSGYSFSNVSDGGKDIIGDSYYDGYSNTNSSGCINDNEQKGGKKDLKGSEDNLLTGKREGEKVERKSSVNPCANKIIQAEQQVIHSQETKTKFDDYWLKDNDHLDKESAYCSCSCDSYTDYCTHRWSQCSIQASNSNPVGLVSESNLTVIESRNLLSDGPEEENESEIKGIIGKQLTLKQSQRRLTVSRESYTLANRLEDRSNNLKSQVDNNKNPNMKILIKIMRIREKIIYGFSAFAILFTLLLVMDLQMDLGYSGHHLVPSHGRVRMHDELGHDTVYTNFHRKFLQRVNASKELTASDNSIGGGPNSRDNTANNGGSVVASADVAAPGNIIRDNTKREPLHDEFGDLVDILVNADNIDLDTGVVRISNEDYSDNPTIGNIRGIPIR
ncbi:hypothetical protein KQX54_018504 [Cotesia glomerata]|uniref:Uncharacterized protein n=1 Tax=Cotesia glomerata TaxID=32391 RepID=A0AAV7I0B4_COTGL|nr:hypothetical protein KQX54_018504 [Cotesia glomerata]